MVGLIHVERLAEQMWCNKVIECGNAREKVIETTELISKLDKENIKNKMSKELTD